MGASRGLPVVCPHAGQQTETYRPRARKALYIQSPAHRRHRRSRYDHSSPARGQNPDGARTLDAGDAIRLGVQLTATAPLCIYLHDLGVLHFVDFLRRLAWKHSGVQLVARGRERGPKQPETQAAA